LAHYNEQMITVAVRGRLSQTLDPRPRELLTASGQMCDKVSQEFILLSDDLGIWMLGDAVNDARDDPDTHTVVLGPYVIENLPFLDRSAVVAGGMRGHTLYVDANVRDEDRLPVGQAMLIEADIPRSFRRRTFDNPRVAIHAVQGFACRFESDRQSCHHGVTRQCLTST